MGAKESRPSSTSDKNRPSASPAATGTVTANTAEEETRHAVTEKESERLYLGFKYNLSLEERGKDAIVVKENREEGGRGDDRGRCNLEKDVEVVVRDHVTNNKYGEERREEAVSEEGSKEGGEKEKEAAWEEELNEGREVKGGEEESGWLGGEEEKLELPCYTQRSNAIDCTFYLKTGTCAYNNNSKFNNPPDRRNNKTVLENVNDEKVSELVLVTVEGLECKMALENANDYNIVQEVPGTVEGPEYKTISENANGDKTEEEVRGKDEGLVPKTISENANGDKTEEEVRGKDEGLVPKIVSENAKIGRRKKKVSESTEIQNCEMALENANDYNIVQEVPGTVEGTEYKMALENANDYNIVQEVPGTVEGLEYKMVSENANGDNTEEKLLGKDEGLVHKYSLSPAGSRSGSMSKFRQQPERYRSEPVELNFMGLPIRRAEKNCFYYMRTGSCKFSTKCRYHHPEPTEVGESDSFSDALPSYTSRVSTTQNLLPHLQGNDYEHPLNSSISLENGDRYSSGPCFSEYQQSSQMTKLPQEPGQSASSYYMKSRNCINTPCKADYPKNRVTGFRTYHHPRNRTSDSSSCLLSPTGLPLRPGRSICQQYSLHGTCKFGRTCVYDHSDLTLLD